MNLTALGAPGGRFFANDVTSDDDGNAYVTNSLSTAIYKVDKDGNAEIFVNNLGANGIDYHPDGYLLAAATQTPGLVKIPLDDPTALAPVTLSEPASMDGIILTINNGLMAVARTNFGDDGSFAQEVLSIKSDDNWSTADVVARGVAIPESSPTTVALRDDRAYIVHAHFAELGAGTVVPAFEIKYVEMMAETVPPSAIEYKAQAPLFPEGIVFDSSRESFVVSSAAAGTISLVDKEGNYSVLVPPTEFGGNGTFGLAIDGEKDLLFAVSANLQDPAVAKLYAFTLSTGEKEFEVDLAALTPGLSFTNDVALDGNENAYITNSDQGIIYQIDYAGNATIFFEDAQFAPEDPSTETGFNGIAFHSDGYLIVTHYETNRLYKVPVDADDEETSGATEISLPDGILNGPDGIELHGDELVVVNNGAEAGFVLKLTTTDGWSSAFQSGDTFATGEIFPTTAVRVDNSYYINNAYFNFAAYGVMPVDYLIAQASFDEQKRYGGTAYEIPRVNTPVNPVGYGDTVPSHFLADCTEGIAEGVVDLQGDWVETTVSIKGVEHPAAETAPHTERIEQCGNRIIIVSAGLLHDIFKADGTIFNGVNDINVSGQPVHATGLFDGNSLILTPVLPPTTETTILPVTRELVSDDDDEAVLKFFNIQLGRTVYMKQKVE